MLPNQIFEIQSAFAARRQITDNVLIAHEMFNALQTDPDGRNMCMAIKIDMSKANGHFEWKFISAVM